MENRKINKVSILPVPLNKEGKIDMDEVSRLHLYKYQKGGVIYIKNSPFDEDEIQSIERGKVPSGILSLSFPPDTPRQSQKWYAGHKWVGDNLVIFVKPEDTQLPFDIIKGLEKYFSSDEIFLALFSLLIYGRPQPPSYPIHRISEVTTPRVPLWKKAGMILAGMLIIGIMAVILWKPQKPEETRVQPEKQVQKVLPPQQKEPQYSSDIIEVLKPYLEDCEKKIYLDEKDKEEGRNNIEIKLFANLFCGWNYKIGEDMIKRKKDKWVGKNCRKDKDVSQYLINLLSSIQDYKENATEAVDNFYHTTYRELHNKYYKTQENGKILPQYSSSCTGERIIPLKSKLAKISLLEALVMTTLEDCEKGIYSDAKKKPETIKIIETKLFANLFCNWNYKIGAEIKIPESEEEWIGKKCQEFSPSNTSNVLITFLSSNFNYNKEDAEKVVKMFYWENYEELNKKYFSPSKKKVIPSLGGNKCNEERTTELIERIENFTSPSTK